MGNNLLKDGVGTLEDYLTKVKQPLNIDELSKEALASLIDHTLLKPEANEDDILKLCEEARMYNFKSVCVNPFWVKLCKKSLKNSKVKICTVIGFPLGATSTQSKASETETAVNHGANEIDMVLNVGALKSKMDSNVEKDIKAVVKAAGGKLVKVILEVCLLTDEEIERASKIARKAGAHYVKTSTGFSTGGATEKAIEIMRKTVGNKLGVKASGGIRDKETMIKMLKAGATRVGASAGIAIVSGETSSDEGKY